MMFKKMQLKTKRRILNGLKITAVIYVLGGLALWFLQEKIFFHPKQIRPGDAFQFSEPHKEENIQVDGSSILNFVKFYPADTTSKKGIVLYFHGNRENINRYASASSFFTKHGYEVWMPDYPGFGKSTGKFSEERLYNDADVLYKLALKKFSADSVIIYGRSLGTCVATQLAAGNTCKQLILETPYYSFPALAAKHFPIYPVRMLVRYQFPLYEYLQAVAEPVLIFHGTDDAVIPYSHSSRLKPFIKKKDEFVTVKDGSHNDLYKFDVFKNKLDSLLQ